MRPRQRDGHRPLDPDDNVANPEVVDLYVRVAAFAGLLGLVAGISWIVTTLLTS